MNIPKIDFSTYCLQTFYQICYNKACSLFTFQIFHIHKVFFLSQIDEDLTARINMADAKFSFQEKGRVYYPAWMSPEGKENICI
jgi:hypothetical protein